MTFKTGASRFSAILSAAVLLIFSVTCVMAQDDNKNETDIQKRLKNAAVVLDQVMGDKDKAIPDKIMSSADCIAVVPSMVKLAVGFGGEHGKGIATCRTGHGWSAPVPFSITGGSWGLQIGGEAIDLVLLSMHEKGMNDLLSSKFKIGAGVSAAAGPVGREGQAATDWKMKTELLTYSRARGVFAGIDLSGAKVAQDRDETAILYGGKMVPFGRLLSGEVPPPSGSEAFLSAVRKYARQANEQGAVAQPAVASGSN